MPRLRSPSYPPLHPSRKNPKSSTTSSGSRMSLCDSNLLIHLHHSRETRRIRTLTMMTTSLSSTSCLMTTTTTTTFITTGTKTTLLMLTSTLYEYLDDPSLTASCLSLCTTIHPQCLRLYVCPGITTSPLSSSNLHALHGQMVAYLPSQASRTSAISASSGSSPAPPSAYFYPFFSQVVLAMHATSVQLRNRGV